MDVLDFVRYLIFFFFKYSVYRISQKHLKTSHLKYTIPFQIAVFLVSIAYLEQ